MTDKPLQIVILEPNITIHQTLREKYESLFRDAGYAPILALFDNQDKLLERLARNDVHVLVSDISLGQSRNMIGLNLIQRVKERYPDIFVIGNSRKDVGNNLSSYRMPTFDVFVDKNILFNDREDYIEKVRTSFLQGFRRNTSVVDENIVYRGGNPFKSRAERNEILSLVQQITFTAHDDANDLTVCRLELEPLTGGRSKSHVFKLTPFFGGGSKGVSTVLKVSDRKSGISEKKNYDMYVRWVLPFRWRPEVLGFGETRSFAAICYSFVVDEDREFDSLSGFLHNDDVAKLDHVVNSVINPRYQAWYSKAHVKHERSISKRYMDRYFDEERWASEAQQTLREHIARFFGAVNHDDFYEIKGESFPVPTDVLFSQPEQGYASCILHGDLNSNNIIMSDDLQNMVFIDFQNAGRGHVFEDFITLEASVRIHHPLCNDFGEVFEVEKQLASRGSLVANRGYGHSVEKIRAAALSNFDDSYRNYVFGVAAYGLRLMRITELTNITKARISASILWSVKQLSLMGNH